MASMDLPHALENYFAYAETDPTRNGRRFSITLPYIGPSGRLDRLQWWYHLSRAQEKLMGESALDTLRSRAVARFRVHIERWLENTGQALYGDGPIPQLGSLEVRMSPLAPAPAPAPAPVISVPLPIETPELAEETPEPLPIAVEKQAYG